jgi:ABC-2 type transport system ATP-binding protein
MPLNLLRPDAGTVRLFGLDPDKDEVAVKSRLAYVPDAVAFYPWMTVRETLDYVASFRAHWNRKTESDLLGQFQLKPDQKAGGLSKGQKTQLALIAAISADPELLILDEPTSGLDPIVRREFIETVIGAYQDAAPASRTIFVSTHLISEFEGLIDEFTIIDQGREVLTATADAARERFHRVRVRFAQEPAMLSLNSANITCRDGREIEWVVRGDADQIVNQLQQCTPEAVSQEALTLEEIFVAALKQKPSSTTLP